jgi:hypothetical protein
MSSANKTHIFSGLRPIGETRKLNIRFGKRMFLGDVDTHPPTEIWVITQVTTVWIFLFFLAFSLLISWQLSIWNCCKPFFSLLCNCQLLYFWRLDLRVIVEVFPRPFFPDIAPSRMFTTNSLCLIICPINQWRLHFKICKSMDLYRRNCYYCVDYWMALSVTQVIQHRFGKQRPWPILRH